jgi:Family of unknown function (DUF5367)
MRPKLILIGSVLWLAATIALRLWGQHLRHAGKGIGVVFLYIVSFVLMAWFLRRLCLRLDVPSAEWPAGAIALLLPTLLLDPFSTAFFPNLFPNIAPEAAGLFGGWMLICCAGGLVGATVWRVPSR